MQRSPELYRQLHKLHVFTQLLNDTRMLLNRLGFGGRWTAVVLEELVKQICRQGIATKLDSFGRKLKK